MKREDLSPGDKVRVKETHPFKSMHNREGFFVRVMNFGPGKDSAILSPVQDEDVDTVYFSVSVRDLEKV